MRTTTLLTTTLISLAAAAPAPRTGSPSKGFNLRVNVTDPTRDLSPSVQNQYLSDQRTGPGSAISVLSRTAPSPAFYLNGTAYHTTITHDIVGVYPLNIVVASPTNFDYFYPTEHPIGTAVNGASELSLRAGEPILFPLFGDDGGSYAACYRDFVLGGSKTQILTARYVYGNESVPDDCAPVEFVVECAVLEDLPDGASWNHDSVFEVPCVGI
ncbi:hypothetical protein CIB48_g6396 [Xylaria polymorpha]|nr:hypothetical protein CIB48_g6396 [Xylaria polymorpha]